MKFKVAVDEAIYAICTYLVEAKTADEARSMIENGEWTKAKLFHQFNYDGNIHEIHSVEPFKAKRVLSVKKHKI